MYRRATLGIATTNIFSGDKLWFRTVEDHAFVLEHFCGAGDLLSPFVALSRHDLKEVDKGAVLGDRVGASNDLVRVGLHNGPLSTTKIARDTRLGTRAR